MTGRTFKNVLLLKQKLHSRNRRLTRLTYAVAAVVRQLVAFGASALEGAFGIAARPLLAHVIVALVDVDAAASIGAELVAFLALALEAADGVAAAAVVTDAVLGAALVHVCAVVVRRELEAGTADAPVGTRHVLAVAIGADAWSSLALIVIDAGVPARRRVVAGVAGALEAAVQVVAHPVLANVIFLQALVHIWWRKEECTCNDSPQLGPALLAIGRPNLDSTDAPQPATPSTCIPPITRAARKPGFVI